MQASTPESPIMLRRRDVLAKTGLKSTQLTMLVADGDFPRPVPLGKRTVAWVQHEVDAWLVARIADRDSL